MNLEGQPVRSQGRADCTRAAYSAGSESERSIAPVGARVGEVGVSPPSAGGRLILGETATLRAASSMSGKGSGAREGGIWLSSVRDANSERSGSNDVVLQVVEVRQVVAVLFIIPVWDVIAGAHNGEGREKVWVLEQ